MKILFICKWNRFRSKIAEDYFNKINKNKDIKVKSAGIIKGWTPLDKYQVEGAKKLGISLKGKPQCIDTKLMRWVDLIVVVGKEIPKSLFESKISLKNVGIKKIKVVKWKISDVEFGDRIACGKAIKEIIKKVDSLIKKLEKLK